MMPRKIMKILTFSFQKMKNNIKKFKGFKLQKKTIIRYQNKIN